MAELSRGEDPSPRSRELLLQQGSCDSPRPVDVSFLVSSAISGAPFLYTGFRAGLLKVSLDNGFDFVDQSRARLPEGRMLAPFQAIRHIRPNYDFNQHDFIIPRGSLKKLQLALSGEVQMEDFRIDIESNGHGGFICDKWNSDVTRDGQRDGRPGHRMGFDQATRRLLLGCEDMVTHSRCISYVRTLYRLK